MMSPVWKYLTLLVITRVAIYPQMALILADFSLENFESAESVDDFRYCLFHADGMIPNSDKPMMTNTATRIKTRIISNTGTAFSVSVFGSKRLEC